MELTPEQIAHLEAELEQARLAEEARIADLKSRFEALSDVGLLQASGISNPAKHFQDAVLSAEPEAAEQAMLLLESQYDAALASISSDSWLSNRQQAYAQIDKMLLEAIAEKEAGRPEKMAEYLILREQIRQQYPKP